MQRNKILNGCNDIFNIKQAFRKSELKAKLLIDLKTTNLCKVVTLWVEVQILDEILRSFLGWWLAWTKLAIDIKQRFILGFNVIFFEGKANGFELAELLEDLLFSPAQGLQEDSDRLLTLTVDANSDHIFLINFEF